MATKVSKGRQTGKRLTPKRVSRRAPKDFPLWKHPSGRWAKKIRQRVHYFGSTIKDPDGKAAIDEWLRVKDELIAGREPRPKIDGLALRDLVNAFLTFKRGRVNTGEIRASTWQENYRACETMVKHFGKGRIVTDLTPQDFASLRQVLADGIGPAELGKRVGTIRSVFDYGYDQGMIAAPVRFGREFKRPSIKALRIERAKRPHTLPTAAQVRTLIDNAGVHLRAMLYMGINCGLGQSDLSSMPMWAVDLDSGWMTFARPKTGCPRKAKLWGETVAALRASIAERPEPKDDADKDLIFITKYGSRWVRFQPNKKGDNGTWVDAVNLELGKLLKETRINIGGGFYRLRHLFRTVADSCRDQRAIDLAMGHTPPSSDMSQHYVESIEDSRLDAVADHVHKWLFRV